MSVLQENLNALEMYQPELWLQIKHFARSDLSIQIRPSSDLLDSEQILSDLEGSLGVHLYGSGNADILKILLIRLKPGLSLNIYDSSQEQLLQLLYHHDLTALISDARVRWYFGTYEELKCYFDTVLLESQDRFGWLWLNLTPRSSLDPDFYDYFQHCAQRWQQKPEQRLPHLRAVYEALSPELMQAENTYDFSCRQGCAQCCEANTGYYLFLNPLEWAELYRTLWHLSAIKRKAIYEKAVTSLFQELDFLLEVLFFLDTQPERLNSAAVQREVLQMARVLPQQSCLFLNDQKSCQVYVGRPLACRLYGNSHFAFERPFTCELDDSKLEQILLDEGKHTQLVDSEHWRNQVWDAHQDLNYAHMLNLWIFMHLDFEQDDFLPEARLDYQQFQCLIRDESLLDNRIQALENAASRLAN